MEALRYGLDVICLFCVMVLVVAISRPHANSRLFDRCSRRGGCCNGRWIILLFGFLFVETRDIDEDKRKTTKELTDNFAHVSNQAADNFKGILEVEKNNFKDVLDNQQRHFSAMATHLVDQQKQQNQEFNAFLTKQQKLFEEQQGFAEFLTGKLLPASDPTPTNSCRTVGR